MKKFYTFLFAALLQALMAAGQIPTDGLVAYYPFTGNANDMSGNGYNGIVNGATLVYDRFGTPSGAYSFDGVNDYIDLSAHVSALNFKQPATVSFWVKSSSDFAQSIFSISSNNDGYYGTLMAVGNNTTQTLTDELVIASYRTSASDCYIAGFTNTDRGMLLDNKWHQLVYIFDSVSTKIYLDMQLLPISCDWGTNNGSYGNTPGAVFAVIGARNYYGLGAFYKGTLDDLRIYNRVLNYSEIDALNNELVGIEPVRASNGINIYPNPAKNRINIETANHSLGYQIKIVNTLNQIVYQAAIDQMQLSIDLNNWTGKGIYFAQLFDVKGDLMETRKIVLE